MPAGCQSARSVGSVCRHACTYVWFDIIRRILSDHAGLVVLQAQGVTDIDDKIIDKANATTVDPLGLAQKFETEFAAQMDKLNVRAPLLTLRVTEHVDDIVEFIEGIERHDHAYSTSTGVYFDTEAFGRDPRFTFGKLHPKRPRNEAVGAADAQLDKRRAADFALWKAAKEGEPAWPSPWGEGRPGWHIECSAMASRVFGDRLDLHTGGKDLAFPHHENEMAQSESFHGVAQWGATYLHSGHVMLRGSKMSKSIGNVVRVDDILARHTADEFRMLCLLTRYRDSFDYDDSLFARANNTISKFRDFGERCHFVVSRCASQFAPFGDDERKLAAAVASTKHACSTHLVNDFDTPSAISALLRLVGLTNQYIEQRSKERLSPAPIVEVARCVGSTLRLLGLQESFVDETQLTTWIEPGLRGPSRADSSSLNSHKDAVDELVRYRGSVRSLALQSIRCAEKGSPEHTLALTILQQCDNVRDHLAQLTPKGYTVRDLPEGSTWRVN